MARTKLNTTKVSSNKVLGSKPEQQELSLAIQLDDAKRNINKINTMVQCFEVQCQNLHIKRLKSEYIRRIENLERSIQSTKV